MIAPANGHARTHREPVSTDVAAALAALANRDAEKSVVCSALLDASCLPPVIELLAPSDFSDANLSDVFAAIVRRHRVGEPIDPVLIAAELRAGDRVAEPHALLAEVADAEVTAAHAEHYAKNIADLSKRRDAVLSGYQLMSRATGFDGPPIDEVLVDAHAELDDKLRGRATTASAFTRYTCRDLMAGSFETRFLIDGALVAGQPLILAGPQKVLKTSLIIDAAISMATATPMLGRLTVPEPVRVGVMTGESGLATLRETAQRVAISKTLHLDEIGGLVWSPDVPRFGDNASDDAVKRFIEADELDVLFVDPAYLALPGADAGNLMIQGEYLRSMAKLCGDAGATLVLAHHTSKSALTREGKPLELEDIAWAGFKEFARQWWLLSRREKYAEGSGEHKLWLSIGGSAGHSHLWAVDVAEGVYEAGQLRRWDVAVSHGSDAAKTAAQARDEAEAEARAARAAAEAERGRAAILDAMGKMPLPDTKTAIRDATGLSGSRFSGPFAELLRSGDVRATTVKKSHRSYEGYELC